MLSMQCSHPGASSLRGGIAAVICLINRAENMSSRQSGVYTGLVEPIMLVCSIRLLGQARRHREPPHARTQCFLLLSRMVVPEDLIAMIDTY
jgi:hypothetical protein